jgi:hypothetical protein
MRAGSCGIALLLAMVALTYGERVAGQSSNATLTAVPGIKVGHHTMSGRSTGCTVVLAERGVTGGVDVRGGAPGTRETALLNPVNTVQEVHAIALAGGSAFGLDTASGVMRYLEERQIGFKLGTIVVPIVPAAILIDLWVEGKPWIRPNADCGYQAARSASAAVVPEGTVGAGAGATVGKIAGYERAMKAGLGSAAIVRPDGLIVAALVVVNARGDVIDPATGRVIAGVRTTDGRRLADARLLLRSGEVDGSPVASPGGITTEHASAWAGARRQRQHDAGRDCDQRDAHQGAGDQGRADGARWLRARHLADSHDRGWRHDLRARDGRSGAAGRAGRRGCDGQRGWRARRGSDGGRDRAGSARGYGATRYSCRP